MIDFIELEVMKISLEFSVDLISLIFGGVVFLISGVVFLYSIFYMGILIKVSFILLVLLFTSSIFVLIFSSRIFLMLLG